MHLHRAKKIVSGGAVVALLLAAAPVTFGQEKSPQTGGSEAKPNDRDLSAFARAYVGLQKIRANYQQSLDATEEPEKKQEIIAEVNGKIASLLEKEGLSADRYNLIFAMLNADEKLREKTLDLITQERSRS